MKGLRNRVFRGLKDFLDEVDASKDDVRWAKMHEDELRAVEAESEAIDAKLVRQEADDEPEWTAEQVEALREALDKSDEALDAFEERFEERQEHLQAEIRKDLQAEIRSLRRQNADLKRKNSEYFEVIQSLEKQRDEWQKRFQVHVSGHLTAQSMYERDLVRSRQAGSMLLKMFNEYRAEKGDEPIELQRMSDIIPVDGEPIGMFRRQLEEHVELLRSLHEAFGAADDG